MSGAEPELASPVRAPSEGLPRGAGYLLLVLTVANVFSYVDRIILNLMVGSLKHDFHITDTQFSLLQGVAFGVFYTLAALPIGRLVDFWDRRLIVGTGAAVFSVCTIACGLAGNFWQLFLARVGVGAGEASLGTGAYSMLADANPREKLAGAIGVYTMGAFVGIGLAYIFGGLVVQWAMHAGVMNWPLLGSVQPWQAAFIMAGLPGLAAAAWVLTLTEPARRGTPGAEPARRRPLPLREVFAHLQAGAGLYAPMIGGFCLITLASYAGTSWNAEFLRRIHGLSPRDAGLSLGLLTLTLATSGAIAGGKLSDWLTRRGRSDGPLVATMIGVAASGFPAILAPLAPQLWQALAGLGLREFFSVFAYTLAGAAIQLSTPNRLRGQVTALYLFAINIVGLGLGPTVTALMSDHVFPQAHGVRFSLACVNAVALPLALLLLALALKPYRAAIARQEAADAV